MHDEGRCGEQLVPQREEATLIVLTPGQLAAPSGRSTPGLQCCCTSENFYDIEVTKEDPDGPFLKELMSKDASNQGLTPFGQQIVPVLALPG